MDWAAAIGGVKDDSSAPQPESSEASYQSHQALHLMQNSLNFFAGLAIPDVFSFLFPPVMIAVWELLRNAVKDIKKFPKIALGIPRGRGKTTLIKLFILYVILFTDLKFILILAETGGKAENILADVVDMLNNSNIIALFGDWKVGAERDNLALKKFGFRGRVIMLAALGAGGSLRGLNIKNARPDLMIFDDIQSRECAESVVQTTTLENWMYGTAMKAKSPHGCIYIFAGNMYPGENSLLKKLRSNKMWTKLIAGGILEDGTSFWEELFPLEAVIEELDHDIEAGVPEIFFTEIMNDTSAGLNTKFDMTKLKEYDIPDEQLPQAKYIIIDPAGNKQTSDSVAIGLFYVFDEMPVLRALKEEQMSPLDTIKIALTMALKHKVRLIAVESVAYQSTLLFWFNFIINKIGLKGFEFVEMYPGRGSKNSRILTMLRSLANKEIKVHPDCYSLVAHQIVNWNPLKTNNTDNTLDLLCYSPRVLQDFGYMAICDTEVDMLEADATNVVEDNTNF